MIGGEGVAGYNRHTMADSDVTVDEGALASLCAEHDLALVLLYGSRASGQTHADSDTDVGVLRRKGTLPSREYVQLYGRISEIIKPGEIDLVDLRKVPGLLKHLACERGQVLYESEPGVFAAFRVLAWNIYQDERVQIRRHDSESIRIALESLTNEPG